MRSSDMMAASDGFWAAVTVRFCPRTGVMRSSTMVVAPRYLQEHVFERRLFDIDVDDAYAGIGDVLDCLGDAVLFGGDDHDVMDGRSNLSEVRTQCSNDHRL